jgi:[glutamine synthetase] adenylyltransferase / [glutamine synthetase]-adenylyl-L-tyrosine phosphorylase
MLTLEKLLSQTHAAASFGGAVGHLCDCSLSASRLLAKDTNLLADLLQNHAKTYSIAEMQDFLDDAKIVDEISLKRVLRQLRQRVILRVMFRDLNGFADLHEVVSTTTNLAEITLNVAVAQHQQWLEESFGKPCSADGIVQSLIVIGMGKLGGAELNVSSDIDLIFAYESDGDTNGSEVISNQDFFTQLGKKVISALDEVTEDGFVFRVDMRLRPFGSEGVLVSNLDALEDYYQNSGREWERYAWIKGRVVVGLQANIHGLLRPFIFRKYLDFNALNSMRDLKLQIHRDVTQKKQEDNIKLGRGGIREIEFIAQVFQLIRGGQDASLQIKPTLAVLKLLKNKGLLLEKTVEELIAAYVFLRNLEHRLMYVEDAQTQELPKTDGAKARIAKAMNYADWDTFLSELNVHRKIVEQHFDATFSQKPQTQSQQENASETAIWQGVIEKETALQALLDAGYSDTEQTLLRLQMLRASSRYQQLPELSRQRFDALMPHSIAQSASMPNPDVTLLRVTDVFESICRRASYLALLAEHTQAMHLLVKLCSSSPWLANYLAQHPILLDELLDTRTLYAAPDFTAMRAELVQRLAEFSGDIERQMDAMRHFKHANVFRFAAQDINGELALETLSDYLSALADLILDVALTIIWPNVKGAHLAKPKFAVIGYGKLGSKELGYASDLDVIFLYDDDDENAAEDIAEIYARFAQRISSWFNTLTSAGLLYETDLQLRPDGNSGLLVSSVAAFREYQLNKAWVWEHQALTRARFVAGDTSIGAAFEAIRVEVLTQTKDMQTLKIDVLAMREKMRAAHHTKAGWFDIKQGAGGIIDVEFLVQYCVLAHAKKYPQLIENVGNIGLLTRLAECKLIDQTLAKKVANAYRKYRQFIHAAKLQEKPATIQLETVQFTQIQQHQLAVQALWKLVFN